MRTLVTGGTGFVGSHLAEHLAERGDAITALVRSPAKADRLRELGARLVEGDLADTAALQRATEGQDVIYHVAGLVAARDEASFLRANRDGTRNLLEAAERAGAGRVVLVSSMAAGGPAPPGQPLTGSEPPRPVTQYGRSKLAAEAVIRGGTLEWTIIRPPTVYGPRDTEVLKVFRLARYGIGPVFGDGSQELSAVFAPDLARALAAAAEGETTRGGVFYACHPEVITSAGFVQAVGNALGRRVRVLPVPAMVGRAVLQLTGAAAALAGQSTILTADKANEFFQPAWTGNPGPLTEATGWRAGHDLESGLARTMEWYRRHGWL